MRLNLVSGQLPAVVIALYDVCVFVCLKRGEYEVDCLNWALVFFT